MNAPAALVHVVDDDRAVRNSLRYLLEGEGLRVRTYASAEEFLAAFTDEGTGCAVVDLRMPGMSGLELQEALARRHLAIPLVFVTAHGDVSLAVTAMKRGAVDFVEKPFGDERLVEAVRRALDMQIRGPGRVEEPRVILARAATLSKREMDVLAAVVEGKSSKTIGVELGIATKTVEAHRYRIMAKLDAPSLAGLVRLVIQHRLLELPRR